MWLLGPRLLLSSATESQLLPGNNFNECHIWGLGGGGGLGGTGTFLRVRQQPHGGGGYCRSPSPFYLQAFHTSHLSVVLLQYVDDILLAAQNEQVCAEATLDFLRDLGKIGYRVSAKKAQIVTQTYVGDILLAAQNEQECAETTLDFLRNLGKIGYRVSAKKAQIVTQTNAGGQKPNLTSSHLSPALQEGWAWRAGLAGVQAPSLLLRSSYIQCLTFLSNFLFSLLGLLALAIGLGLAVKGSLGSSGGPLPTNPMLGLVLGGLVVSVVGLVGCLGTLCENTCLLCCFSGVLPFLVLEAMAGILVVALWGPLQDGLEHTLHVAIVQYDNPDLCFPIDQVQLRLQCCGAASYQDWQQNMYLTAAPGFQGSSLSALCCIEPWENGASVNNQCGFRVLGLEEDAVQRVVHLEGCGAPLLWLRRNVLAVGDFVLLRVLVEWAELLLAVQLLSALAVHKGAVESSGPAPRPILPLTDPQLWTRSNDPQSPPSAALLPSRVPLPKDPAAHLLPGFATSRCLISLFQMILLLGPQSGMASSLANCCIPRGGRSLAATEVTHKVA
ncbi:LOW QUALITY PROTEIN: tetraspanin-10 [Rhynchonycteris naso]